VRRREFCLTLFAASAAAQDFSKLSIEKIDTGFEFVEGPVWAQQGFLLFSDVPRNEIRKMTPGAGRSEVYRANSNGANGNTYDSQGRLYTCESITRRVVREDKKGKIEVIAESFEGKKFNAPNDIVIRKDGHIYFTDPAFGKQADTREMDYYGVYHITPKKVIELVAKPKGRPNGIALSPNGRTLYVANSDERNVRTYDLDKEGKATNERVFVSDIGGVPDGIKLDEKGNLYVTCKGVEVYSPQAAKLATLEFSETPANCCFGEADWLSFFVTARTSLYRVRFTVKGSVQY
jgi:gluconolactonase